MLCGVTLYLGSSLSLSTVPLVPGPSKPNPRSLPERLLVATFRGRPPSRTTLPPCRPRLRFPPPSSRTNSLSIYVELLSPHLTRAPWSSSLPTSDASKIGFNLPSVPSHNSSSHCTKASTEFLPGSSRLGPSPQSTPPGPLSTSIKPVSVSVSNPSSLPSVPRPT